MDDLYGVALVVVGDGGQSAPRSAWYSGWSALRPAAALEVADAAAGLAHPAPVWMFAFGGLALVANAASAIPLAERDSGMHVPASWIFSVNDAAGDLRVTFAGAPWVVVTGRWPGLILAVGRPS